MSAVGHSGYRRAVPDNKFELGVRWLSRLMAIIAAMSMLVLMFAITIDVTVRFITRSSVPGLLELSESSLVVAVFFGLAWAGVDGAHVAVTLLADRLSERVNIAFDIVVWALASVVLAWLVYGTGTKAISSTALREERFGLVRWPEYPWRWVIVVGLAALLLVAITNLARALMHKSPFGQENVISSIDTASSESAAAIGPESRGI